MKIITKEEVPQLISVIEEKSHDPKIGNFCKYILETLNFESDICETGVRFQKLNVQTDFKFLPVHMYLWYNVLR